jgi:hypothetical protein
MDSGLLRMRQKFNGKKNETETLRDLQRKSGLRGIDWGENADRVGQPFEVACRCGEFVNIARTRTAPAGCSNGTSKKILARCIR